MKGIPKVQDGRYTHQNSGLSNSWVLKIGETRQY